MTGLDGTAQVWAPWQPRTEGRVQWWALSLGGLFSYHGYDMLVPVANGTHMADFTGIISDGA